MLSAKSSGGSSSSKGGKRMRLKWRRSRFSRRIMIHMLPHCSMAGGHMAAVSRRRSAWHPLQWHPHLQDPAQPLHLCRPNTWQQLRTCARYTGSMTSGISSTKLMAPVTWYSVCTCRTCGQQPQAAAAAKMTPTADAWSFQATAATNQVSAHYSNKPQCDRRTVGHLLPLPAAAHLLPWHGHVLQQLVDRVRHKLERSQVHTLVMPAAWFVQESVSKS